MLVLPSLYSIPNDRRCVHKPWLSNSDGNAYTLRKREL